MLRRSGGLSNINWRVSGFRSETIVSSREAEADSVLGSAEAEAKEEKEEEAPEEEE